MENGKNKKMIKYGLILVINMSIMPFIIMTISDYFLYKKKMFTNPIGFIIAMLWMYIFGRIYSKKITKLKQEIDASKEQ